MILLITNREDITTDFIVQQLQERNITYYRLNTEQILNTIDIDFDFNKSKFYLFDNAKDLKFDLSLFKGIYYRRPKLPSPKQNTLSNGEYNFLLSEIQFVLEGLYRILDSKNWVSSVYAIRNAENKIYQLLLAKQLGFKVPKSLITTRPKAASEFTNDENKCIVKPIKSGFIDDIEKPAVIFTSELTNHNIGELERVKYCPTFFQNNIKKFADIRATVVGKKVFTAQINSQEFKETCTDWRKGSNVDVKHEKHDLPADIQNKCIMLVKHLGLQFGAVDLVLDNKGEYTFLEINPNGQWAWIEKRLNYNISNEIVELLISS